MNALYTLLLIQTASAQNREQIFCIKLLRIYVSGWKSLLETIFSSISYVQIGAKTYKSSQVNIILHCLTFKYNLACSFSARLDV